MFNNNLGYLRLCSHLQHCLQAGKVASTLAYQLCLGPPKLNFSLWWPHLSYDVQSEGDKEKQKLGNERLIYFIRWFQRN